MFNRKLKQQLSLQQTLIAQQQAVLAAISRSMATIEFEPNGTILTANDNFLATVGYTLHEIAGKHHRIFCEERYSRSPEYAEFWRRLQHGEFISGQFKRFTRGGEPVWLEASYNPVFDAAGKLCKVIKFAQNITPHVHMTQEHENKIKTIHRSMAVIEFEPDGAILTANDNFLAAVGYTLAELKGQHHRLFCAEDYAKSADYQDFWRRLQGGEFIAGQFEQRGKGGRPLFLEASYNPVFDADGKLYKVIKFASDVTERELNIHRDIEHAKEAHSLSEHTEAMSQQGASVIETAAVEMRRIASSAKASAQLIEELGEQTSKITSIVNTIHDIADQTNLLALNAAIEAARAGEQGRGFAVVADEVRKLAERTTSSTAEIASMIENIRGGTHSAITSMQVMLQQAERGVEHANDAGTAITKIRDSTHQVVEVINGFSAVAALKHSL